MLSNPNELPVPAVAVISELRHTGQQAEMETQNPKSVAQCGTARFTSPAAEFLPPESQQCRFYVVKPPKGASPKKMDVYVPVRLRV